MSMVIKDRYKHRIAVIKDRNYCVNVKNGNKKAPF